MAAHDQLPDEPIHRALLAHLEHRGALFWADLVAAASSADLPYDDESVLAALWDLVWAGAVTNDSLAPLRAMLDAGSSRSRGRPSGTRGRLRVPARSGPKAGAGRWSLVAPLLQPAPSETEAVVARATQLLDRYGVLTREMALAEGVAAGFAGVYPVLKSLEEQGKVRRGYFVAGLGAAQFAHPGAVDRLRVHREPSEHPRTVALAATDPAQPLGAAVAWPPNDGCPSRSAGCRVLFFDGRPLAFLDRKGRSVTVLGEFGGVEPTPLEAVAHALADFGRDQRAARLEVATVDGVGVAETALGELLIEMGWRISYRGLRPPT